MTHYMGKIPRVSSNNMAELEALIEELKLSMNFSIKKLIIEGHSQIILNVVRCKYMSNWKLNSKLEEALSLIDNLDKIKIQHIYREGNKIENALVNKDQPTEAKKPPTTG